MKKTVLQNLSNDFVASLKENGVQQIDVAMEFGISQGQISRIFNGTRTFTLDQMSDISFHFNISLLKLLARHVCKDIDEKTLSLFEKAETNAQDIIEELDKLDNNKVAS